VHRRLPMYWHAFAQVNKSSELDRLVGRVDELLARLPEDPSPEMDVLRDRVDRTILATWLALGTEPARAAARIRHHRRIVTIAAATIAAAILVGIAGGNLIRRML
jgi:hypothetical protein